MLRQTEKRWISSPLGSHLLQALLGNENPLTKKYLQIDRVLEGNVKFNSKNYIFYSAQTKPKHTEGTKLKNVIKIDSKNLENYFNNMNSVFYSENNNNNNKFISKCIKTETSMLLCNICSYKDTWSKLASGGSIMKVHNSFSYTEDVKYETRFIEFPMNDDDFKLIIIMPNEVDVLSYFYNTLCTDGLTIAMKCIHPLFTSAHTLNAPHIEFGLETDFKKYNDTELAIAELGNVKINDDGILINVVTCMFPLCSQQYPKFECYEHLSTTFYFGLIYRDMPIFIGKYCNIAKN